MHTMRDDYVSTPSLPDDKGRALLEELTDLYHAISFDPETNKKVRSGSRDERYATAALEAAMIKAAANFEHHRDFTAWLPDYLSGYDPVFTRIELTNKIHDLKWRVDCFQESHNTYAAILGKILVCLPPEVKARIDEIGGV